MAGQVAIEIRWDGTTWTDETDHVMTASWSRGRGYASQVVALAGAGSASLTFRNDDGRYSYWEPTSPRYLTHLHGVGLRVRLIDPTPAIVLWTGVIDDPSNNAAVHNAPVWPVQGLGTFSLLTQPHTCEPVGSGGDTVDVLMGSVLDAAGWPADQRVLDTGVVTTGVWQPGSVEPLAEIRKLEATELGFVYEGRDGQFHFEARNYRPTTTRCTTSQLTLSDDPGQDYHYRLLNLTAPEQYVYDRIKVDFQPVFTLDDEPAAIVEFVGSIFGLRVPAGKSRRFTLEAFHFYGDPAGYRVVEWVLPTIQAGSSTSTVQIDESGGGAPASAVTISAIATTDTEISFTLSNSSDQEAIVGYVLLYGIRGLTGQTISQIVGSGTREYPLPGSYYPEGGSASKAARWLLNYFGQPRHLATVEIPVSRSADLLTDVFACDLSSRITLEGTGRLTKLGMTQDFFVESERVGCGEHGRNLVVQWQCSACLPNTQDLEDPESSLPTGLGIYYPMEQSSGDVIDLVDGYDLTRHGTTTTVGRVGRGQQFVAVQGDALLQPTNGLPDDHLNDENEWNGWVQIGSATFDDQIILRKGLGAQAGYVLYTTLLSSNQYIQAAVWNGTTLFTTTLNGHILVPGDWHFFRLVHDAANLRIGVSTDLGPFDWVTYTGSIVSSTDGIIFGGAGSFGIGTTFEYWYKAPDVPGADGDAVTTWADRSGNGRDADTPSGSVTVEDGELVGQRIVRFGPGVLRVPEIALGPVQIFLVLKITSQSFQGTIFRTSATPGPNYAVGLNENFGTHELFVHFYTDHNNSPIKRHVVVSAPPLGYAVYRLTDDGTGGALELAINGVVQTLVPNGANLTGASGIDPDGTDELDVFQIIVATGLSPTEVGIVEDALLYEAGLGGSPPAGGKSLNGILDEWGFWPERFLTDVEAESLFNHGAGTTSTGGTVNTTSPSAPSVVPGNVPSGTLADRPTTAPTNSLYFATDEQGGTLYLMIGSTWTQVASGLTEDIPRALVDAKGDLVTATAADTPARLAVGTNGQLLAANSGEPSGLEWIDPPVIPTVGQYRQLLYSSPDGIHFDLIDDGAGHPVTVLADLE